MTDDKVDWDDVYKRNYESIAFWDIQWIYCAKALLTSASEIEPRVCELWDNYQAHMEDKTIPLKADYYQGTYFMLIAYAVENLFKAAIVRENSLIFRHEFQSNKKFPTDLKSHELVELAKKAGFNYSLEEEDLLRRLTRHAIWAGRYPIPLGYKESAVSEKFSNGSHHHISWFGKSDIERLNSLIIRIKESLELKNI